MKEKKKYYDYDSDIKDLSTLEESKIKTSVETVSGFRNLIRINIDKSLINSNLIDNKDEEIKFILLIKFNFPFTAPFLLCLTKFSVPELSDGRDFLEDVLSHPWIPRKKNCLKKLVSLIPDFINNYLENIHNKNYIKFIGKFYLDNNYEFNILKLFPNLYYGDIIEIVPLGNDKKVCDEKRKIMITDGFLLLFVEKSIFEPNKLKLIFWGPIGSLSLIRQVQSKKVIELTWKIKKEKISLMRLKTENDEKIFDILMECLTKKKIQYKIENLASVAKKGEIPPIDIGAVEQEISKLEIKIKIKSKDGTHNEIAKQLMNLYEKAVQYYSAINDQTYQIYTKKTKKLISQMSDKDLGGKKGNKKTGEAGEKKKKGKKGKIKKEKSTIEKEELKKEEKKEIKEGNQEEKDIKSQKEEKKEKEEDKKVITAEKESGKVEEKKDEKKEEKKEEEEEDKKDEKVEEKKDEKVEEKNEEKVEEKKNEKEEVKKEKHSEKENVKEEHPNNGKSKEKKEENKNNQNKEENKEVKKEEDKNNQNKEEKSKKRQIIEKSGFNLDLDDDDV